MSIEHADREERLGAVLVACLEALDQGRQPDQADLLARYPDLASEVAQFLADQGRVERRAAPLRGVVQGRVGAGAGGVGELAARTELGDFRIVRKVARGGMGVVYEAQQLSLARRVALKVLPAVAALDERLLQRFKNEAQAAAGLHHQNIVPVYFVGCERGVHFYAMQFIEGSTLAQLIAARCDAAAVPQGEPTTPYRASGPAVASPETKAQAAASTVEQQEGKAYHREVARLGIEAALALEHAHALGIVHRDVKPANLMLDGQGKLWVTDFGLAHLQHAEVSLTMSGELVGTLRYMSPEQALAKRVVVDQRTDVYSLGATLYELLTLRPAFAGQDCQELLRQIAFEEPQAPRKLDRSIPPELETIVLKALEKSPAQRYDTAQELADDLERYLNNEPIRARRPTLVQRLRKWGRRHQAAVTAAAVCLVVSLAVVAGSAWQAKLAAEASALVEKQERDRARMALARQVAERLDGEMRHLAGVGHALEAILGQSADWQEDELVRVLTALLNKEERIHGLTLAYEPRKGPTKEKDYCLYVCRSAKDPQKIVKTNLLPGPGGYNPVYRDWPWYKLGKENESGQWTGPSFDGDAGANQVWMVGYSLPMKRGKETVGIVCVDLELNYFAKMWGWLAELNLGEASYGFVVNRTGVAALGKDATGVFMSHPHHGHGVGPDQPPKKITDLVAKDPGFTKLTGRILKGEAGQGTAIDPVTGRRSTFFFTPVSSTQWSFVAVIAD